MTRLAVFQNCLFFAFIVVAAVFVVVAKVFAAVFVVVAAAVAAVVVITHYTALHRIIFSCHASQQGSKGKFY